MIKIVPTHETANDGMAYVGRTFIFYPQRNGSNEFVVELSAMEDGSGTTLYLTSDEALQMANELIKQATKAHEENAS